MGVGRQSRVKQVLLVYNLQRNLDSSGKETDRFVRVHLSNHFQNARVGKQSDSKGVMTRVHIDSREPRCQSQGHGAL